jgi:hypothetical protein
VDLEPAVLDFDLGVVERLLRAFGADRERRADRDHDVMRADHRDLSNPLRS